MSSEDAFHFGVVGEGSDATIAAFGSSVALGVPEGEAKAWACQTCTFWNTETMGRFCSMCGSRRFVGSEGAIDESSSSGHGQILHSHSQGQEVAQAPTQQRYDASFSEAGDTFCESPFVFSPIQEDKEKLSSISDTLGQRSPRGTNALEKSFSVFGLLDDDNGDCAVEAPAAEGGQKPALSAKEFQMSFANWSISDQGAWTCGACTFVNANPLHLQCELCGQNRPTKTARIQNQKVMQDMMETSFRTGQHDFLRQQQEKIEEIEERVIAAERMKEIVELQAEMLDEVEEEKREIQEQVAQTAAPSAAEMTQKSRLAEEYLDDLERVRKQELEEQNHMEAILEDQRRRLGMERMGTERCLQEGPIQIDSKRTQVRAQEQLLFQWKQSYRKKEDDIVEIRKRQQEIMNRWR
jgi:hypothetical protein